MNVLITGGAGFIGSHLARRLLAEGFHVVVLDDLSTGSLANIADLSSDANFTLIIGSVFDRDAVAKLVDGSDLVFHLAAAVGVLLVVDSPVQTIETNVQGTEIVLREAARKKKRVIITSTSEVYGKSSAIPFEEGADLILGAPTLGRWSYACSKALDEFLGLAYWSEQQVPVTIVRLFNTVGPGQSAKYGMVLPNLIGQALREEPLTVYGTGDQTRCFCYVAETVECLIRICKTPQTVGEIINIGNDEEISIKDLALLIKKVTGSPSPIINVPYEIAYRAGFEDMQRRVPFLGKLENQIGYRPRMPLQKIIERVWESLRETSPVLRGPSTVHPPLNA